MLQIILGVAVIVSNDAAVDVIRHIPSSSVLLDTSYYHRGRFCSMRSASHFPSSSSSISSAFIAMHRHRRCRDEQSPRPKINEHRVSFVRSIGEDPVATTRSSLQHIILSSTNGGGGGFSGDFYDDFEELFGELGGGGSSSSSSSSSESNNNIDLSSGNDNTVMDVEFVSSSGSGGGGDGDMMRDLRARMNDLSRKKVDSEEDDDDDDEEEDDGEYEDSDTGSALPDLEGSTISNIDDLIGFAQARARENARDAKGTEGGTIGIRGVQTWEDENWARPIPLADDMTNEQYNIDDLLEGGIVLIANPARFCSDLAKKDGDSRSGSGGGGEKKKFLGGLFDDPFPTFAAGTSSSKSSNGNGISPALLAKFGITLPPSPDLGPDRRADLLPVVLLINRDSVRGSQAVLMNRRTGNLMGDLPSNVFESTTTKKAIGNDDEDDGDNGPPLSPPMSHPLSAFMIQPLWWAGSSPGGSIMGGSGEPSKRGGISAIDMIHACPYVNGSIPLSKSDGLYWGGSPVQAQEAMRDSRLERPLSGFDFKFFIQTTRWLPGQVSSGWKCSFWFLL